MCAHGLRIAVLIFLLGSSSFLLAEDRKLYFGLLHSHTSFSDGEGSPAEAFESAKDAGLDFFALTEHNHSEAAGSDGVFLTPTLYNQLKLKAQELSVDGEFLAIYGQEISTISKGNHQNIFFAGEICDMPHGNFKYLYESWLPAHPETTIVQMNHPNGANDQGGKEYGLDDYGGDFDALRTASAPYVRLIEVIKGSAQGDETDSRHQNGKYDNDYLFYLNKGFYLGPSVGEDNHKKNWGKSMHARLGVWATELTRSGIEEALFNRHCFASEDDSLEVQFTLNGNIMGSFVDLDSTGPVNLKVLFKDEDEPSASYRVQIFYDDAKGGNEAQVIESEVFDAGTTEASFSHVAEPGGYYLAKVIQISDHPDDAWTAPIWLQTEASPGVLAANPQNTDDPPQDTIDWDQAADYVGQTVTVTGKVIRAHNHQDKIVFFNFDSDFEDSLSLILFEEDFEKFGGADSLIQRLSNKSVSVKGEISLFRQSRMQLKLTDISQIVDVQD